MPAPAPTRSVRSVRRVERRRPDERGVVLVWMALSLVALLMFAAFMVDLGSWYKQSQDIQRTVDAAALAGSTYLPDNPGLQDAPPVNTPDYAATTACNFAAVTDAHCAAMKIVIKNGYGSAGVATWVDPGNNRQLDVSVKQGNIQQYFTSFFMGPLTFTRSSHAQFSQPIDLGSPQNYFGTGTLEGFTGFTAGSTPNFWASIAGYCEAKEAGDEYASGFDGNVTNVHNGSYTLGGSFPTNCNPSADTGRIGVANPTCVQAQNMNCEFDPLGYEYTIQVPAGMANTPLLYIFNANFNPCLEQPAYDVSGTLVPNSTPPYQAPLMDTDSNLAAQYPCSGSPPANATSITTYYSLAGPTGFIGTWSTGTSQTISATGYPKWTDLTSKFGSVSGGLSPGTYYLDVSTINVTYGANGLASSPSGQDTGPSYGVHNYGVLVGYAHGGSKPSNNLNTGGDYVCTTAPCATVYANTSTAEAVTIVSPGGSSAATAYLANVPTAAVGKTVTLKLWDPGDYAQYIQIMKPNGTPLGSAVGDPTISYAVYGADPNAASLYGGTIPQPNNTSTASGTLNGCTDPLTGSPFAGSPSGPCFPVDGCTQLLPPSGTGATTPLTDCGTDLAQIGTSTWGAPNQRYGMSRYSDSLVQLSFVAQTAGWYGISEATSQAHVHDTLTLNLLINGLPPHLTP